MGFMTPDLAAHAATAMARVASGATTGAGAGAGGAGADSGSGPDAVILVVLTILLGSSVIGGLVTTALGNLRAAATARREGYALAVRTLIARSEYPYRVRRRVSDAPEVLAALAQRGHDLQEQVAACRTWVASEHRVIGALFEQALADIDAAAGPHTAEAWQAEPILTAAGMNLGGWGPGNQWPHVLKLERAIAYRFGWRRVSPSKWWLRRI